MEMELIDSDDEYPLEQTMFCPDCGVPLYPTDGDTKFFLFLCRACGYEDQLDYRFSWENNKVNGIPILPRVKHQRGGTCVPNAMVTAIESRLKFVHAKHKNIAEDLSVDDLMEQYEEKMEPGFSWEDGYEGETRIELSKEICEANGILTAKAFQSKERQSIRYKAKAFRKRKSSFLASSKNILKGNVLFTTVPITKQFKKLKGEEMYIADPSQIVLNKELVGENHGVVLVGFGRMDKVDYFRFMNSYGTRWGDKGFANVRANEVKDVTRFELVNPD